MKKSPQKILAEMEYIQKAIDTKEVEISRLKGRIKELQKELVEAANA